jgi:Right handed beta helix region
MAFLTCDRKRVIDLCPMGAKGGPVANSSARARSTPIATFVLLASFAAGLGALSAHRAAAVGACPKDTIAVGVGASIQKIVDAAPEGASFCIKSGVHRLQTILPKNRQKFFGDKGAVLNGARLLDHFDRSGDFWVAPGPEERAPAYGVCLGSRPACNNPHALFVDDAPFALVTRLDQLTAGKYFIDYDRGLIYLMDNPKGRKIELAAARVAIGSNGARDVTVRSLIVEKYASLPQRGAVYGDLDAHATGWLIEGNEVRFNSGAGILVGANGVVRGNKVHHNGQLGVHPQDRNVLIENNEIAYNNIYGFDATWEAGGLKAARMTGLTIRKNYVHHNQGPGLWCDIECRDVLYESNRVEFNADAGIFHEISFTATIRSNRMRFNGCGGEQRGRQWFWAAEILVAGSGNVEVHGNVMQVGSDGTGIALVDQGRQTADGRGYYRTEHNFVHDNDVTFTGKHGKYGAVSDRNADSPNFRMIETGGNRFDRDVFRLPAGGFAATFGWGLGVYDFEGFRAVGQELNGRIAMGRPSAAGAGVLSTGTRPVGC